MKTTVAVSDFLSERLELQVVPSFGDFAVACLVVDAFAERREHARYVYEWAERLLDKLSRVEARACARS